MVVVMIVMVDVSIISIVMVIVSIVGNNKYTIGDSRYSKQ